MAKACSATIHFPSMQIKHGWHLSRNEAICKQASAMLHISLNACMHSAIPLNFYFKINNTPAYFICSLACLPTNRNPCNYNCNPHPLMLTLFSLIDTCIHPQKAHLFTSVAYSKRFLRVRLYWKGCQKWMQWSSKTKQEKRDLFDLHSCSSQDEKGVLKKARKLKEEDFLWHYLLYQVEEPWPKNRA